MSSKFEMKRFEEIVNTLKEISKSDDDFVIKEDFKRSDIMIIKPNISGNEDCSEIIDKYLSETTFKVLHFTIQNKRRLDKHPKIKAITSLKTSPLILDIYNSVLDKIKSDYNIDYSLINTHIVDDENVLYLMVDEPIIYHMRDKCDIVEDESGHEYRIIDLTTKPTIYMTNEFIYGGSYYPGINPKNTVYLGDIESYKEDSKFKGAVIGNPTKNKL